jgi:dihydropteroate synthase
MFWHCKDFKIDLSRARVMGIVNVTPDSFADGVRCLRTEAAVSRARTLVRDGADMIDLGAESTAPGATPVAWQVEWARLKPVLHILSRELRTTPISVDTYHPETARLALEEGASIINCVHAASSTKLIYLSGETGCGLVLPCRSADEFSTLGLTTPSDGTRVLIDPMIGFGTTREEDMALLGGIRRLTQLSPVLVGVSRKRVIGAMTDTDNPADRLGGSVGAAVWCAMNGVAVVRAHDVKETKQALDVARLLAGTVATQTEGDAI